MPLMPGVLQVGPIPSSNFSSNGTPKIGACVHVIVGSGSSALGEFRNQGAQLSAHFIVAGPADGWPDGTILQVLDTDLAAYAQGAGNYPPISYIAIEVAGTPDIPMTAAQVTSVAAICAWGASAHGYPISGPTEHGTPGITTHCHPDGSADPAWGGHPCPGLIRLGQVPQIVALASGQAPTPPPEVPVPVAAPIVFAGQFHVLQVNGGHLWHKWSADGANWGNEDVFKAAGVGQPALSTQVPGVTVSSTNLLVTVEDSTGKGWFFKQPAGAAWGVSALP